MGKSKLVIAILFGFLTGLFFGDLFTISLAVVLGIIVGLLLALLIFWKDYISRLTFLILIGIFLGLGFIQAWKLKQNKVSLPYDQKVSLEGSIIAYPEFQGAQAKYLLKIFNSKVELQNGRYPEYQYGDRLKIEGTIKKPLPYLLNRNILGEIWNPDLNKIGYDGNWVLKSVYQIRDKFEKNINKIFKEPLASFAAGLVLGSKRSIPDSLMTDFNRTGTTHIVAVSGYNLTIIIINLGILLGLVSRRLKVWGSLIIILLFVLMTGASASVVRAGILVGLAIFGKSQGRRVNMLILILLTATLMAIINPYVLKYDISFQLSFLAFIGLIYLSPIISRFKIFFWLPPVFKQALVETLGAQVMVLPILIYYFGQMSLIAPVVNVLILWIIPASMLAIFLSGLFGFFALSVGQLIGLASSYLLRYIIFVVESFSRISFSSVAVKTSEWWWLPIYFLAIAGLIYYKRPKPKEL